MFNNPKECIKTKVTPEKICDFAVDVDNLYCPVEDPITGTMYLMASSGELFTFNEGSSDSHSSLPVDSCSICFDTQGGLYIADFKNNCIYYKNNLSELNFNLDNIIISQYENKPFSGINSMIYNSANNCLYFSDCGKLVENNLYPAVSSLFLIDLNNKVIKPVLYECLSYISDIVYDSMNKVIYLCEMFENRIIKVKQNSSGSYYSSIFYQFSGRLGPRAIALDDVGHLYIARYEVKEEFNENNMLINDGLISIIDSSGIFRGDIYVLKMPEIIGLCIPSKKKDTLYITINENKSIFKIKLSNIINQLEDVENQLNKFFI